MQNNHIGQKPFEEPILDTFYIINILTDIGLTTIQTRVLAQFKPELKKQMATKDHHVSYQSSFIHSFIHSYSFIRIVCLHTTVLKLQLFKNCNIIENN